MPDYRTDRLKVYISGPITKGCRNKNFYQAAEAHQQLINAGFAPFNPMASMLLPFAFDETAVSHSAWLECDFPWIAASHAVLRLPGYSVGADAELAYAKELGIPIFYSVAEFLAWRDKEAA